MTQSADTEKREGTFPIPLTPAMLAAMRGAGARTRYAVVAGTWAVLSLLVFSAGMETVETVVIIAGVGAVILGINEYKNRQDIRESLRSGSANRYVGRIDVRLHESYDDENDRSAWYELTTRAAKFRLSESEGIPLADLRWATVEYTDVAGFLEPGFFLLDVHNADDISVYRHPDYRPS